MSSEMVRPRYGLLLARSGMALFKNKSDLFLY